MSFKDRMTVAGTNWRMLDLPPAEHFIPVLWPVVLFDAVVAEDNSDSSLNVFQEAILELCTVGVRDVVDMSNRLHLDQGLVAVVLKDLIDSGRIDAEFRPLAGADRDAALENQLDWRIKTAVLDTWTGRLMPVLLDRLELPSITWKGNEARLEFRNTKGRVAAVDPPAADDRLRIPTAKDVQDASGRADSRRHTVIGQRATATTYGPPLRVQSLSDTGTPALMPVVFYLPKAPEDAWGLGALGVDGLTDLRLLTSLEQASATDPVASYVRGRLDSTARKRQLGNFRDYCEGVQADADAEVDCRIGSAWRSDHTIWTSANNLAVAQREFEIDPDRAPAIARTAAIEAGLLLEAIGIRMRRSRPLHEALSRQPEESMPKAMSEQVRAAHSTWAPNQFPHQLLKDSIAPTSTWWNWALAVAAANSHNDHPLRMLLGSQPEWLRQIVPAVQLRNRAAHADKKPIDTAETFEVTRDAWALAVAALNYLEPGEET